MKILKIKIAKIFAVMMTFVLVLGLLSACGSDKKGDASVTAKADDEWRDAFPQDDVTTKPALTDTELDAKIKEILGTDSGWDGDYAN